MQQRPRYLRTAMPASLACLLTAACLPVPPTPDTKPPEAGAANLAASTPADARPGTCWHQTSTPAVVETTTRRVLVSPADISADGTIRAPARYRNEDSQRIVTPRQTTWIELVCPNDFTPEFSASLQRALQARGYYDGVITGTPTDATKEAIRQYQQAEGMDAPELTVKAAQRLGLRAISR